MSYRIASFNIQKFSGKAAVNAEKKDLEKIAQIIKENKIDILAIQEILHPDALKYLLKALDGTPKTVVPTNTSARTNQVAGFKTAHWEGRWAAPKATYGYGSAEGYAFIWNTTRIELVSNYKNKVFEPRIETFSKEALARTPMIGRFKPLRCRCEFRLINTHIIFDKPSCFGEENSEQYHTDLSTVALRQKELEILLKSVYSKWDDKLYDVNHQDTEARFIVPYTFLMGDYNLNLEESPKIREDLALYQTGKKNIVTVNKEQTTLKKPSSDPEKAKIDRLKTHVIDHLANNYDHFSYDINKIQNHNIEEPSTKVLYDVFRLYSGDANSEQSVFELYRQKISDHLPIVLEFDIRKKRVLKRFIAGTIFK